MLFYSLLVCLRRNKCTFSISCITGTVLQSSGIVTLYVSAVHIVTGRLTNCGLVPGRVKSV